MPKEGISLLKHEDILSFEEITCIIKKGVELGIEKIRITGGEPLVRNGVVNLVKMISQIKGIKDLSLTTNGILLEKFAKPLAEAGLQRTNISLDTINPEKYNEITRGGNIKDVYKGIDIAKKAGLNPIKINCVVLESSDEPDAKEIYNFCKNNDLEIRYIHKMNLETGKFSIVEGGNGGDCKTCNRLRLTANGMLKPCLFSEAEFDTRTLGINEAYKQALFFKPELGTLNKSNKFYNIGG